MDWKEKINMCWEYDLNKTVENYTIFKDVYEYWKTILILSLVIGWGFCPLSNKITYGNLAYYLGGPGQNCLSTLGRAG